MKYKINIVSANVSFESSETGSILDSALNKGIHLSYSCKSGSCGQCESTIVSGIAKNNQNTLFVAGQKILTCSSHAASDLSLKVDYYPELAAITSKIVPCKVDSYEMATADVMILRLKLPPTTEFIYLPGQYIDLNFKGVIRSYSIANSPSSYKGVELHIRKVVNGQMSDLLFNGLAKDTLMRLSGPCGTFFVRASDRPIIFLAGGTGFAPVKAMVEQLLDVQSQREIHIYWGMNSGAEFYTSLPDSWMGHLSSIHFIPVVSGDDSDWCGRRGLVHMAVIDDFESLSSFDVYACGSLQMINAAKNIFIKKGLIAERFYSDAFTAAK